MQSSAGQRPTVFLRRRCILTPFSFSVKQIALQFIPIAKQTNLNTHTHACVAHVGAFSVVYLLSNRASLGLYNIIYIIYYSSCSLGINGPSLAVFPVSSTHLESGTPPLALLAPSIASQRKSSGSRVPANDNETGRNWTIPQAGVIWCDVFFSCQLASMIGSCASSCHETGDRRTGVQSSMVSTGAW